MDSKCITSYGSIGDQESLLGASFGFGPHYLVLDQTRKFSFFVLQSLHGKTTPHSPKPVFLHRLGHALEGFLIKIAIFKHSRRHDDVKVTTILWSKTKSTLSTSENHIKRREGHESGLQLNWPIFSLLSFGKGRHMTHPDS